MSGPEGSAGCFRLCLCLLLVVAREPGPTGAVLHAQPARSGSLCVSAYKSPWQRTLTIGLGPALISIPVP